MVDDLTCLVPGGSGCCCNSVHGPGGRAEGSQVGRESPRGQAPWGRRAQAAHRSQLALPPGPEEANPLPGRAASGWQVPPS